MSLTSLAGKHLDNRCFWQWSSGVLGKESPIESVHWEKVASSKDQATVVFSRLKIEEQQRWLPTGSTVAYGYWGRYLQFTLSIKRAQCHSASQAVSKHQA